MFIPTAFQYDFDFFTASISHVGTLDKAAAVKLAQKFDEEVAIIHTYDANDKPGPVWHRPRTRPNSAGKPIKCGWSDVRSDV